MRKLITVILSIVLVVMFTFTVACKKVEETPQAPTPQEPAPVPQEPAPVPGEAAP